VGTPLLFYCVTGRADRANSQTLLVPIRSSVQMWCQGSSDATRAVFPGWDSYPSSSSWPPITSRFGNNVPAVFCESRNWTVCKKVAPAHLLSSESNCVWRNRRWRSSSIPGSSSLFPRRNRHLQPCAVNRWVPKSQADLEPAPRRRTSWRGYSRAFSSPQTATVLRLFETDCARRLLRRALSSIKQNCGRIADFGRALGLSGRARRFG